MLNNEGGYSCPSQKENHRQSKHRRLAFASEVRTSRVGLFAPAVQQLQSNHNDRVAALIQRSEGSHVDAQHVVDAKPFEGELGVNNQKARRNDFVRRMRETRGLHGKTREAKHLSVARCLFPASGV